MIDVALIGAGRIGKIHGTNLARQPGMRLRFVCDAIEPAAEELAGRLGAATCDLDRIFGDASIGAVVIASSTDTHAELIVRAAAAGEGHLLREAGGPRSRPRPRLRRRRRARGGALPHRLSAPLRSDLRRAQAPARCRRDRRSRDPGGHQPRSRRAARGLHPSLGRHLQGHADPRLRYLPLDPRRRGGPPSTRRRAA